MISQKVNPATTKDNIPDRRHEKYVLREGEDGERGWWAGGSVVGGGWEDYICWVAISNSDHEMPNIPTCTLDADLAERTLLVPVPLL